MNSYYSSEELKKIGLNRIGSNVMISKKASIDSPELVSIGSNVRIDDYILIGSINCNV